MVLRRFMAGLALVCAWAANPSQDPAATLDALLASVWEKGAMHAYELYNAKPEVTMEATRRAAYKGQLLELARSPHIEGIFVQRGKGQGYSRQHLPEEAALSGAAFRQRVHERMKADGVDPAHPDRLMHRP